MIKVNVLGSCVSRVALLDGDITGHGIADERLELDCFFDKQNMVCAMLPPPFSREEVDGIRDICMNEKYALRSLKQNLNKDTLQMITESSADWVVVDFMDMHMAHAKYNGTVFATQALEFYRTNLGESLWDVEKVRFLEQPFEEWKEYVDGFWQQLIGRYGAGHIILNRFRCNRWYMSVEGKVEEIPERFHGPSHPIPGLNQAMLVLEDYIINTYQPWVIDLSKYFMGDQNMWENVQGAHFEKEFYRETFDTIISIIFGETNAKYVSKPYFFDKSRRGILEDKELPLNIEQSIDMMKRFCEEGDLLWMNLLDKLYMRIPNDQRIQPYLKLANV